MAAELDIDFHPAAALFWTGQEAPRFAVFLKFGHAAAAGGKDFYGSDLREQLDGEHVPDVIGDDVADDKVDVTRGVAAVLDIAAGVECVSVDGAGVGGFDLDAPGAAAVVEEEVVTVTLSPGFGDGKTERGGFEKEGGFGHLSATLGGKAEVAGGFAGSGQWGGGGRRREGRFRVFGFQNGPQTEKAQLLGCALGLEQCRSN